MHTIQDRYSLLREHYKDLPKLLAGCSATFPSKKVTKDTVNDNQTVRERARDLREFFAALLVSLHTAKLGRGHDVRVRGDGIGGQRIRDRREDEGRAHSDEKTAKVPLKSRTASSKRRANAKTGC